MRVTADTNLLVRGAVLDDPVQASRAAELLRDADLIAVTLPALCEFAWVLGRGYRWSAREIFGFIRALVDAPRVVVDRASAEAGLALMAAGGDFADGVIAFEGNRLGGAVFASFDRRAAELVRATGGEALLL
ncbi:MAG TPA: type II toxin-antitoxin system VapC family toxin [Stellaceae bacterium]|nr:type II toxin-antitoxin system VapC family toxin [Stellaceae bacterium]